MACRYSAPLNNRGDDTFLAGELDKWGGHCGRGDDYHYHIAPVHLEDAVGKGNPIAFALDGFPVLGFTEQDGSAAKDLDEFNGHFDAEGNYHYHATETFPYVNGGLRGVVSIRGDQVDQPRDSPIRPAQQPLRGATITGFSRSDNRFELEYEISGQKSQLKYSVLDDGRVQFTHIAPSGQSTTEVYRRDERAGINRMDPFRMLGTGVLLVAAVAVILFFVRSLRGHQLSG